MMSANMRVGLLIGLVGLVGLMWVAAFASKQQEKAAAGVAALDPRVFESLTVVAAGTGGTFENHWRRGPALVVGTGTDALLVDAGRSVTEALRAAAIPLDQPRSVLLSSLSAANVLGLDDLWLDAWLHAPDRPLRVYGPPGTAALVQGLKRAHAVDAAALSDSWAPPAASGEIVVVELAGGEQFEVGAMQVRCAAIAGAATPALAWRIEAGDRAIAVAVAGTDTDAIARLAQGAHVLAVGGIYDASLALAAEAGIEGIDVLRREAAQHLRLEDLGELATRAGVRSVLLTRLRPPPVFEFQYENLVGETYRLGPVFVAEDGEAFTP